ncbi:MAG: hypothetical protein JW814_00720 [Candidatus Krumholzibacteriota bacterium]|nr:hypothetical protein [Candidatus Krumholzibacteriota bacterium]
MKRITVRGLLLAASLSMVLYAVGAFSGCAPARPRPEDHNDVLDSETVVMLDTWVTTQLSRQKEWVEDKNGFIEPHIILRNKGGKTLQIEIRTYFKDKYGGTIETAADTWTPATINPHEDFHYHRLCLKKEGVGYQFHIRLGKEKR